MDSDDTNMKEPSARDAVPCVVSFLDIMGYKKFIETEGKDVVLFHAVSDSVSKARTRVEGLSPEKKIQGAITCRAFSDNIAISCGYHPHPKNPDECEDNMIAILAVLSIQAEVQMDLLADHGLLSRGGTALGDYYVDDGFVFGKGLVDAYELENKKAKFPRMLVSRGLVEELQKSIAEAGRAHKDETPPEAVMRRILAGDNPDEMYVDYIPAGQMNGSLFPERSQSPDPRLLMDRHYWGVMKAVTGNIDDIRTDPGNWGKYAWAIAYHNRTVEKMRCGKLIDPSILYHR